MKKIANPDSVPAGLRVEVTYSGWRMADWLKLLLYAAVLMLACVKLAQLLTMLVMILATDPWANPLVVAMAGIEAQIFTWVPYPWNWLLVDALLPLLVDSMLLGVGVANLFSMRGDSVERWDHRLTWFSCAVFALMVVYDVYATWRVITVFF